MPPSPPRVVVLGAGMAGLLAAVRCREIGLVDDDDDDGELVG